MKNKKSVDFLGVSVQIRSILRSAGIKRICDLEDLSDSEMYSINGINVYMVSEIKRALREANEAPYELTEDNTIYFMQFRIKNGEMEYSRTRHAVVLETAKRLHLSGIEGERGGSFTVYKERIDRTHKTGHNNYQLLTYDDNISIFLEDVKQLREIEKEEARVNFLQEQERRQNEISRIAEMIESEKSKE